MKQHTRFDTQLDENVTAMPTKKLSPSEALSYKHSIEFALAMHMHPNNLPSKLKAIWNLTVRMIKLAELEYPKIIKSHWEKDYTKATETEFLLQKAHIARKNKQNSASAENILTSTYISAINLALEIQKEYHLFENNSTDPQYPITTYNNDTAFLNQILADKNYESKEFLNKIVPHFFSLQLYCYQLIRTLDTTHGSPLDPIKRQTRASAGGSSRAFGEEILKELVIEFFNSQKPKPKYQNVKSLFYHLGSDLSKILDEYKKQIGRPAEKNGKTVRYGAQLTLDGLERKVKSWKNDESFRAHLERICRIRPIKDSPLFQSF